MAASWCEAWSSSHISVCPSLSKVKNTMYVRMLTRTLLVVLCLIGSSCIACAQGTLPVPAEDPSKPTKTADPNNALAAAPGAPDLSNQKGWLGVALGMTGEEETKKLGLKAPRIRVNTVFNGSPAEASGFKPGDIILAFQGEDVTEMADLISKVKATPPRSKVRFLRLRDGKRDEVPLFLGVRPDGMGLVRSHLIDRPAPALKVNSLRKGEALDVGALKGKVVVVDFWATWCGPCRATMPHLSALYEKYQGEGFQLIGISDEKAEVVKPFLEKNPLPYPIGLDAEGEISRKYIVSALPTLVGIDRKGTIREVFFGAGHDAQLEGTIKTLLAEK